MKKNTQNQNSRLDKSQAKTPNKKPDKITETIDYIFKMLKDGRMDKEEADLVMEAIFSGELEDQDFDMFRFMYLFRPKGGLELEDFPNFLLDSPPDSQSDVPGMTITIEIG